MDNTTIGENGIPVVKHRAITSLHNDVLNNDISNIARSDVLNALLISQNNAITMLKHRSYVLYGVLLLSLSYNVLTYLTIHYPTQFHF